MAAAAAALLISLVHALSVGGQLAGGWSEADPTSAEVVRAARAALDSYNASDSEFLFLMGVRNASSQVVQGIKYRLNVKLGVSSCRRRENFHRACFVEATTACTFEVVVRAWLEPSHVTTSGQCGPRSSSWTRVQVGGRIVGNLAHAAVRRLRRDNSPRNWLRLGKIVKAYENIDMDGIYKVTVSIRSRCPPCVSKDQQYTVSRANLYLTTNSTRGGLLDCTTDGPVLMTLTRCRAELPSRKD